MIAKGLRRALVAVLVFVGIAPEPAFAQAARFKSYSSPNGRFMLFCRLTHYGSRVTDNDLRKWAQWLDTAYAKLANPVETGGMGFRRPIGARPFGDQQSIPVDIRPLSAAEAGTIAFARTDQGTITLNLNYFEHHANATPQETIESENLQAETIAHELFHLIQFAYDPEEDGWLFETTANWAAAAVFPQNPNRIGHETNFVRHARYPLTFDEFSLPGTMKNSGGQIGHPYGGSVLFRFLETTYVTTPEARSTLVRTLWENCAAVPGPNSLQAIAKTLDGATFGDAPTRARYDRFAVGVALGNEIPADGIAHGKELVKCRLPDMNLLNTNAQVSDLSVGWLDYCRGKPWETSTPGYSAVFSDPPTLGPDVLAPGRPGDNRPRGWLGVGGVRTFTLAPIPDCPAGHFLEIKVPGGANDLSVQGVARFGAAAPLQLFKSTFQAPGMHVLSIPKFKDMSGQLRIVLTRYQGGVDARNYPMTLTLKRDESFQNGDSKLVSDRFPGGTAADSTETLYARFSNGEGSGNWWIHYQYFPAKRPDNKRPQTNINWTVYRLKTPDEAKIALRNIMAEHKESDAILKANEALTAFRSSYVDESVHNISSTTKGFRTCSTVRAAAVYRDVFVIVFMRHSFYNFSWGNEYTPDKPLKEDYAEDWTTIRDESKKLIDKRFP